MKRLLLYLLFLLPVALSAQTSPSGDLSPRTGYKYFVGLAAGCNMGHSMKTQGYDRFGSTAYPTLTLTTTHGSQLSRQLFVGAGAGASVGYCIGPSRVVYSIPVYAACRYTPMQGRYSMALGLRLGYSFGFGRELNPDGPYLSPSAGIRIALRSRLAVNLSLSYVLQRQGVNTIYTDYRTTEFEHLSLHGLMAVANLEF